VRGWWSCSR